MRRRSVRLLWLAVLVLLTLSVLGIFGPERSASHVPGGPAYRQVSPGHPLGAVVAQEEAGEPEANLPFLFAVYTVTWLGFFGYAFYVSRRQGDLRREIQALRQELQQHSRKPDQ